MGAAPSVSSAMSPQERRSIPYYLGLSPLSVAMSEGSIANFATCFELVTLEANADLEASKRLPGRCGDFFVVGDGQVDVSVKVPSANKKTGYIREVLCSKKQGDILYVPAVESLAGFIQQQQDESVAESAPPNEAIGTESRLRRTSARLARLLSRSSLRKDSIGVQQRAALVERGLTDMAEFSEGLAETISKSASLQTPLYSLPLRPYHQKVDQETPAAKGAVTTSPKSRLKKQKADESMVRMEKLIKHLDMTTVTAPYGATLLRLDKGRFEAFEAAVLRTHRREYGDDGSLVEKALPWSRGHTNANIPEEEPISTHESQPTPPLPDFELMRVMMTSNIQDYLKRIPFLTKVPNSRIQMLGEMSQFEVLPADQIVCQEGEEVNSILFSEIVMSMQRLSSSNTAVG